VRGSHLDFINDKCNFPLTKKCNFGCTQTSPINRKAFGHCVHMGPVWMVG
jgi:hypothetical protein